MKDWKAMFGRRMGAAAMLVLLLTATAGSRVEAGRLERLWLERLRNGSNAEEIRDEQVRNGIRAAARASGDEIPSDAQIDAQLKDLREEFDDIKKQISEETGVESDFIYENDINLVVLRNSADEIVYIGPAILRYDGDGFAAMTAMFDEEVASAIVGGAYELDISTVRNAEKTTDDIVMCNVKGSLQENEGAFLHTAYAHPLENATMVYYDEELDVHADAVTLQVHDNGKLSVDNLPENMQYPAALINADNALIGWVGKYAANGNRFTTTFRDPSEEGMAAAGDTAGDATGDAAGDAAGDATGDAAGDAPESAAGDAPEGASENWNPNWDTDLGAVFVSYNGTMQGSWAVALRTDPPTVFSQTFDEGIVSAYFTTGMRAYDLNTDSMENIGNGSSYWTIKDSLPDDDPGFLDSGYAHQNESATIVYYVDKNNEYILCAESVTLTECSENGQLTADHYPEDMTIYPAVLVNADNECLGIIHAGGIIVGGTDPETFYGDAPAASEGVAEGAQEGTAGSAGETPAANPAVSVEPEEAVHPAVILGEDIGKMVNTSAVQLDGDTYVLTSTDTIEDFDYEAHSMSVLPEDLPENNDVQIRVLPLIMEEGENNLQIVALIGFKQQDSVIGSLPVADAINPEHQLGYVFSYVSPDDSESENMYDHVWQDYILHYSPLRDNLYLIEDEIEYQDNLLGGWPGALIYDVVTYEAVGIGTYVDGKYAFEDITTDMRAALDEEPSLKELLPMKGWGALAKAAEGE